MGDDENDIVVTPVLCIDKKRHKWWELGQFKREKDWTVKWCRKCGCFTFFTKQGNSFVRVPSLTRQHLSLYVSQYLTLDIGENNGSSAP